MRQDETSEDARRSVEPSPQKKDVSCDREFSLEIMFLLEELCQSALDDDAQGVAVCSDMLAKTMRRGDARPN